jgi:hypothetical protein
VILYKNKINIYKNGGILSYARKLDNIMKENIKTYITSSSTYKKGKIFGLNKPNEMNTISEKASGVSMGADKNGFFVYTHRARSKSHSSPLDIPKKEIDFIESTG